MDRFIIESKVIFAITNDYSLVVDEKDKWVIEKAMIDTTKKIDVNIKQGRNTVYVTGSATNILNLLYNVTKITVYEMW